MLTVECTVLSTTLKRLLACFSFPLRAILEEMPRSAAAMRMVCSTFEAAGRTLYLNGAGRSLDFIVGRIAPAHNWRIPEHYLRRLDR